MVWGAVIRFEAHVPGIEEEGAPVLVGAVGDRASGAGVEGGAGRGKLLGHGHSEHVGGVAGAAGVAPVGVSAGSGASGGPVVVVALGVVAGYGGAPRVAGGTLGEVGWPVVVEGGGSGPGGGPVVAGGERVVGAEAGGLVHVLAPDDGLHHLLDLLE